MDRIHGPPWDLKINLAGQKANPAPAAGLGLVEKANITARAQAQALESLSDYGQSLLRNQNADSERQKHIVVVVELPHQPREAKLASRLDCDSALVACAALDRGIS